MGPYEFAAFCIVLPMVVGLVWIARRFETDGVRSPDFEEWCKDARPVLFALQCAPGAASRAAWAARAALGPRLEVEHHRGRHPWTRYLFAVALEIDPVGDVLVGRVDRCAIRRGAQQRPELGKAVDLVAEALGSGVQALWVHADLREDDDATGPDRRDRGWVATRDGDALGAFTPTSGLPAWARLPAAARA
jgi:hypothetical protein